MKRKSIKRIGIISTAVIGAGIFLFLMLPFLDKTPSATTQTVAEEKDATATPQIFTSNPLTNIVERIAHFFNGKKSSSLKRKSLADELAAGMAKAGETAGEENALMASAKRNDINYLSSKTSAISDVQQYSEEDADHAFSDAMMMDEDGDWIFVRQRAPEGTATGMHEVNAHDNAYDAYVKQQRNAKWSPSTADKLAQEVPDYSFAQKYFVNPIKNLFGRKDSTPTKGHSMGGSSVGNSADISSSSDGLGGKIGKQKPTTLAQFRDIEDAFDSLHPGQRPSANRDLSSDAPSSAQEFWAQLLNPSTAAERAGKEAADIIMPAPASPEEQAEKEKIAKTKAEQYNELWRQRFEQMLDAAEPLDPNEFKDTLLGCHGPDTLKHSAEICDGSHSEDQAIANAIRENKDALRREFGLPENMDPPTLQWTPIYGSVQQIPDFEVEVINSEGQYVSQMLSSVDYIEQIQQGGNEDVLAQKIAYDKYQEQIKDMSCGQNQNCYLVVNKSNANGELDGVSKAIVLTGQIPVADPINKNPRVQDKTNKALLEKFKAQLKKKNIPEQEQQQLLQQFTDKLTQTNTPYIIYTDDELENSGNLYFQNIIDSQTQVERLRANPSWKIISYGQTSINDGIRPPNASANSAVGTGSAQNQVFNGKNTTDIDRSRAFNNDLIRHQQNFKIIHHAVESGAMNETATNSLSTKTKSGNASLQDRMRDYTRHASPHR